MSLPLQKTSGELWRYAASARPDIEGALEANLPAAPAPVGARFNEALNYALFPGGKRLRPVLTLLGAELVGGEPCAPLLRAAAAVEYVHTSSLIFDDLPCMDDADERRGRAPLHRRYGEGLAVLVAVALLNASYGLVFDEACEPELSMRAHHELVSCVGTDGMVTGQALDLSHEAGPQRLGPAAPAHATDSFERVRNLKTSALMRLSLRVGATLSGADAGQLRSLSTFAELLGQAYQVSDDVLDLAEDAALAGAGGRVSTLALQRGPAAARLQVRALTNEAKQTLAREFGHVRPARLLGEFADYIAARAN